MNVALNVRFKMALNGNVGPKHWSVVWIRLGIQDHIPKSLRIKYYVIKEILEHEYGQLFKRRRRIYCKVDLRLILIVPDANITTRVKWPPTYGTAEYF